MNGTAVLAEMFEKAGHRVFSRSALSPGLKQKAQCIVWFPNDFQPPQDEVRQWLEEWLDEAPGRTLIYVGRDFDAEPGYWAKVEPGAPSDQLPEIQRRRQLAASEHQKQHAAMTAPQSSPWFTFDGSKPSRSVRSLEGDPRWTEGIDARQLEITLESRLIPADAAEVRLGSEGDALVTVEPWVDGKLIVVANGSFLLNLPLVNREHRKLAGKLIGEVGPPGQSVVFLESWPGGPQIRKDDKPPAPPTGLELFTIWPTSWILLHLTVVGLLFCFWRVPIFGRPGDLPPDPPSDFGKHIQALADLFRRAGDQAYARQRIEHYQQLAHPETKSRLGTRSAPRRL